MFLKKISTVALTFLFVLATLGFASAQQIEVAKRYELKPLFLLDTKIPLRENMKKALRKCQRVEGKNNFHLIITGYAQIYPEKAMSNYEKEVKGVYTHVFYKDAAVDGSVILKYKNRLICSNKPLRNFRIDKLADITAVQNPQVVALKPLAIYYYWRQEPLSGTMWKLTTYACSEFIIANKLSDVHFIMLLTWNGDNDGSGSGWVIRSAGCANVPFSLPFRPLYKVEGRIN